MKKIIIISVLIFSGLGLLFLLMQNSQNNKTIIPSIPTQIPISDTTVKKAKEIFQQKKSQGIDMKKGQCLSNNLLHDWVADVAHNPRQLVDDIPENQCNAFSTGFAHHFVELDPNGQVIRVY